MISWERNRLSKETWKGLPMPCTYKTPLTLASLLSLLCAVGSSVAAPISTLPEPAPSGPIFAEIAADTEKPIRQYTKVIEDPVTPPEVRTKALIDRGIA